MDLTTRTPTLCAAKFIVRDDSVDQEKGYPEKCVVLTRQLIAKQPATFNAFFDDFLSAHENVELRKRNTLPQIPQTFFRLKTQVDDSNWEELLADPKRKKGMRWVNRPSVETNIRANATGKLLMDTIRNKHIAKHRWSWSGMAELFSRKPKNPPVRYDYTHFTAPLNDHEVHFGTALTFRNTQYKQHEKIYHPANIDGITQDGEPVDVRKAVHDFKPGDNAYEHEHRWALISQNYATAMDSNKSKAERIDATINCYWMVSQDCPFERGSATFSRILLEALSHQVGFEVPPTKPGKDLNYNAVLTDLPTFKQNFKNGRLFDLKTRPDQIMAWHEAQLQKYQTPTP